MLISNFATRLKEALSFNNMKASEVVILSEELYKNGKINKPLTKPLLSHYLKGTYEAKQDNLYTLSIILNVDEAWLMGYDVPMHKQDTNVLPTSDVAISIPVVGRVSAGFPILATENLEGYAFAPSSKLKPGYDYFYLIVKGDSMNLKFNEGDLVLVQKQDDLENDEIGVIAINGDDATVKKFKKQNGLVILEPMSTNPENTVQVYNPEKIPVKIMGKVIAYQGNV